MARTCVICGKEGVPVLRDVPSLAVVACVGDCYLTACRAKRVADKLVAPSASVGTSTLFDRRPDELPSSDEVYSIRPLEERR